MGTIRWWCGLTVMLLSGLVACSSSSGGGGGASGTGGAAGSGGGAGTGGDAGGGGIGGTESRDGPVIDYAGTVGPDGGVVEIHNGRVKLDFPPGAVSEDIHIRVSPLVNVGVPGMVTPTAFDFGPDGSVFAEPVTLTLGYNQSEIPDGVEESELIMLASSHDSAEMVLVPGSTVDPVANTITATISGFTVYGMAIPNCTIAGGPLPWCPPRCEIPAPTYPDDPGGELDTSFGDAGTFSFDLGLASSTACCALLIDEQGRLLLGASELRMSVIRVLPDGEGLDTSFGDDGVALVWTQNEDSSAVSIALRTDGRIVLHGVRQPPGGGLDLMLARFMSDGSFDTSFGDEGVVLDLREQNWGAGRVATLPDGSVLVTDGVTRTVRQFLPDGSPDLTFGTDGIATADPEFAAAPIVRRATGDWLLGRNAGVQVVDAQGVAGILYANAGPGGNPGTFQEIAGGLYVMGARTSALIGDPVDVWAARFHPGDEPGSLESDPCFAGNGAGVYDFGGSEAGVGTAVQSDGRIVIAGSTNDRGDDDDLFVVRIRPDGELDAGFGTDGIVYIDFGGDEAGGSVAIDDQGRIVVAGSSRVGDSLTGDRFGVVARLLP
ncbi:MAG: hypothetical protein JRE19_13555 [Deltaproteobacteria bacterium]|nr:hypothetical protein [Deltaproteobacteria bacterium]